MNIFELLFFLLFCVAVGFVGHLVSPRYGWLVGAVVGGSVLALLLVGSFRGNAAGGPTWVEEARFSPFRLINSFGC